MTHPSLLVVGVTVTALIFAGGSYSHGKQPAKWKISHPVYKPNTSVSSSAVAAYMAMSEKELRAQITAEGGKGKNVKMKQVVYDMARLYQKTKKAVYADRAVILLERFAEVVPRWPMLYCGQGGKKKGVAVPKDKINYQPWYNGGLWGRWHYSDLHGSREFALAYDFVADSGALERRGRDTRRLIEENLLRYVVEFNLKFSYMLSQYPSTDNGRAPFAFTNMGGSRIEAMIYFGRVFDPQYIHLVVRWLRAFPKVMFYRDGMWHETSPSYHEQILRSMLIRIPAALKGYSDPRGYIDPVDGTRFDNLDVFKGLEGQLSRIRGAMEYLTLPDDTRYVLHDTHSGELSRSVDRDSSNSYCYFGIRHAVMGRFSGKDQVQVHLHFGGTDGHAHYDCLNLGVWALGEELFSEGEYKKYGNRPWNMSTAGHNTVVVDEADQRGRGKVDNRTDPDHAVDGFTSYNPCSGGHGSTVRFGNLRLWDPTHPHLQVIEVEGENSYGTDKVSLYRRTIVMVEISGTDFYLIDVFRVKGGKTHDWMLHGRLNEDYEFRTDLTLGPSSGKRFRHLKLQKKVVVNSTWSSEFISKSGARIRTTMLGYPNTEVSICRAPAMRRKGEATFLDVRRSGDSNLFVCVHEPYRGTPKVKSVRPIQYSGKAESPVCIEIELAGGRRDYFACTLDQPPYALHSLPRAGLKFAGRLVHVAKTKRSLLWMYLLDGRSLSMDGTGFSTRGRDLSYRGRIVDVKRVENGDTWNGFITVTPLPTDGRLKKKTLLLILPDGRTEGYTIARIEKKTRVFRIHVNEEPGIELRDDGKLVKLVYYPWHGLRGKMNFLIPGSAYRDRKGKVQATVRIPRRGRN